MITGPPGAGKTSVAEALVGRPEPSVLVDGDAFFRSVRSGWIAPWEPEAHEQNGTVIRAIGAAAEEFAAGGYVVVVDGVIGPWFLGVFLEQVKGPVCYVILRPSFDVAMSRALAREEPELVDPAPISHMFDAFTDLGEHERSVIDTTTMSVAETTTTILRLISAGELVVGS